MQSPNIILSPSHITRGITKFVPSEIASAVEHIQNWEMGYLDLSSTGDPSKGRTWVAGAWTVEEGALKAGAAGLMTDNFIPTIGVTYTLRWKHTGASLGANFPSFGGTAIFGKASAGEYEEIITATTNDPLVLSPAGFVDVEYFSITS